MASLDRRSFLGVAAAGVAGAAVARGVPAARAQDDAARINVLIDEPIGTIAPEIYGHFIEHLGGVIYDGVWVGEQSKIPNIGGVRKALVDAFKTIKPGVLRWPGGCFADSYDWHDGIGPADKRPRRTDFWADTRPSQNRVASDGPQRFDPNRFGTNEFVRFCRLTGASPYIAANVRSLPARDFYQWVEYCNAPDGATTLSALRAASGDAEPFGVRYWGVGNEPWGCGGNFAPEEYATEFRRYTAWVPKYGVPLKYIAAGPNGGDLSWTRGFFRTLTARGAGALNDVFGWALHYYSGTTGDRNAVQFSTDDWYELIARADRMESLVTDHWAAMAEFDPAHKVKLVVDEWGAWHGASPDMPPNYLWAYPGSLRDAIVAALTLDTFNRHADKIAMANVAQLINTIHSLFLAREDRFIVTPNFHVFALYAAHQGGQSLRAVFEVPSIAIARGRQGAAATLWGLAGSASRRDREVVLTVVNPHATDARSAVIALRGGSVRSARATVLAPGDLRAHNSFDEPNAVRLKDADVTVEAGTARHTFPSASVTRIVLALT
ncbi:MAG TPA: alpha-L-arabinofuranosidase C-terminal domain-containing protein [Vicinamibacterales bacterium]|nr:alpha-L-arabinofuranosidase C-terminal domain-containing protein [Vicinamibacterales bacterium]